MNRIKWTVLGVVALSAIAAPALSAQADRAILGTWRGPYAENCQAVRDVTTEDFMIITPRKVEGYEGTCAITKFSKTKNEYSLQKLCEGEGETFRETMTIKVVSPNRILVNGNKAYERCD